MIVAGLSHLDRQDALHLKTRGIYEPWETSIVQRDLKPGQVFVDVGAHIGYYTVMASGLVGPSGKVYAFEPAPKNFRILKSNVAGLKNIRIFPQAASIVAGAAPLFLDRKNSGDNRLTAPLGCGLDSQMVPLVRLDHAIENLAAVSFVKIDVQGHEPEVLAGMQGILDVSRRLRILVEYAPDLLSLAGHRPEELLNWLHNQGFSFVSSRTHDHRNCTVENRRHSNLYCTRGGQS